MCHGKSHAYELQGYECYNVYNVTKLVLGDLVGLQVCSEGYNCLSAELIFSASLAAVIRWDWRQQVHDSKLHTACTAALLPHTACSRPSCLSVNQQPLTYKAQQLSDR
jgi:hypothetical protein